MSEYDMLDSTKFYYQKPRTTIIVILTILAIFIAVVIILILVMRFQQLKKSCTITPSTPKNILVGNYNSNTFRIQWSKVLDATGYAAYVGIASGFTRAQAVFNVKTNIASADVIGLTKNQIYYFYVTSLNECGESANSTEFSFFYS